MIELQKHGLMIDSVPIHHKEWAEACHDEEISSLGWSLIRDGEAKSVGIYKIRGWSRIKFSILCSLSAKSTTPQTRGKLIAAILYKYDRDKLDVFVEAMCKCSSQEYSKRCNIKGLGVVLLDFVEAEARQRGMRTMSLQSNAPQLTQYYERLGFRVVDDEDIPLMTKTLQ
jgi:GNAT superfamily N-acetyltransferase